MASEEKKSMGPPFAWCKIVNFAACSRIQMIALTLNQYAFCAGFTKMNAFLGESGEVRVCVYRGDEYWEFTVEPDELISFTYEVDGKVVCDADCLTFEDGINMFQVWRKEKDDL